MRPLRTWLLVATACVVVVTVRSAVASEAGQAAADQVSESSYRYFLGDNEGVEGILYTHDGDDRGFGPEHALARWNISMTFMSYGLNVSLEPFLYLGDTYYNVVAEQPGTTYPDQIYIIGAHFDSVNNPGADDNASGVSLTLEAARILSQYDSESTIRYIAFDREEQGLYGSSAYVDDHFDENILGMISADMVAYDPNTNHARIYGTSASLPIKQDLAEAIDLYGDGLTCADYGTLNASDHAPFEAAGFQACLLIEGEVWNNPHYHDPEDSVDTPGYINYGFAVKMTRSVVGYLVDQADVLVQVADGDYDDDGDVDARDFVWFQACFSGDGSAFPGDMGCHVFDFYADGDVDLGDFAELHDRLGGP